MRQFVRFGTVLSLRLYKQPIRSSHLDARVTAVACSTLLLTVLLSCASPQAIGPFADSAQKALAAGPPLFTDIHDSCVRRQLANPSQPILPLFVPPGSKDAPPANPPAVAACARFATEAQGLIKVSDVLTAYFRAIQQLSAFNISSVSTASETTAENAATAADLDTSQIDSAGKLASLVTRVFTESYQRSRLLEYLRNADPQVVHITEGFDTVTKNYLDFLQEEQQTLTARYQSVADTNQQAMVLLLNRAYSDDLADIQRRRTAAGTYRDALKSIREGHHQLVENAQHLNAKELSMALQPYTSKLDGLIPAPQKNN